MYRILSDFYPAGATPQLTVQTVFVPGAAAVAFPVQLAPDLSEKAGTNMRVALETIPPQPVVGNRTHHRQRERAATLSGRLGSPACGE